MLVCDKCGERIILKKNEEENTETVEQNLDLVIPIVGILILFICSIGYLGVTRLSSTDKLPINYLKNQEIYVVALNKLQPKQLTSEFSEEDMYINEEDINGLSQLSNFINYVSESELFYADKKNEEGYSLYYKDLNKKEDSNTLKIDSNIVEGYVVAPSGDCVYYIKDEQKKELYKYNLKDKECIDVQVNTFWLSPDGKQMLYFTSEDNGDIGNLYLKEGNKDKVKIDSEVQLYSIQFPKGNLDSIYYIKDRTLYRNVFKKKKEKLLSDFKEIISIYPDGSIYYTESANEKEERTACVEDDFGDTDAYNLYYYNGKESKLISENVCSIRSTAHDEPVILYSKYAKKNGSYDVEEAGSNDTIQMETLFVANKGVDIPIELDSDTLFTFTRKGDIIYMLEDVSEGKDGGTLVQLNMKDGSFKNKHIIDKDVVGWDYYGEEEQLLYYKDVKDGVGDIYFKGKIVASDACIQSVKYIDTNSFACITDYSYGPRQGTLSVIENGKNQKISENVFADFFVYGKNDIFFLHGYNIEKCKGELCYYKGAVGKIETLDKDVTCILNPSLTSKAILQSSLLYY